MPGGYQPYRKRRYRPLTAALKAMKRGRPKNRPNPAGRQRAVNTRRRKRRY